MIFFLFQCIYIYGYFMYDAMYMGADVVARLFISLGKLTNILAFLKDE